MYTKVYVVTDQTAIEYLQNDDLEGFKQYLSEDETLEFGGPHLFLRRRRSPLLLRRPRLRQIRQRPRRHLSTPLLRRIGLSIY